MEADNGSENDSLGPKVLSGATRVVLTMGLLFLLVLMGEKRRGNAS